jgi:hypothetical protein
MNKLGEDKDVVKKVKHHLKSVFKNKYFKLGYKAASKDKSRSDNPYTLPSKYWDILRKRTYWEYGWEQKAFSKSPKELEKINKENEEFKKQTEKRLKHERREKEEKKRRKEERKSRKSKQHHHSD